MIGALSSEAAGGRSLPAVVEIAVAPIKSVHVAPEVNFYGCCLKEKF